MQLPKPTAIIFDWDNTLVDTWPIIHSALVETFNHMGEEPWSFEESKQKVGQSLRDHFPKLFGDRWKEAGDFYSASYRANHLDNLQALPEAIDLLEYILPLKLHRALVSNKQGPVLRLESEHMGWNKYFHKVIGATDAKRDKPFPDPALLALSESGIEAGKHVWFVGDSSPDVDCAIACGMTPIIYNNPELAKKYGDDVFSINNHTDLKALLEDHFQ